MLSLAANICRSSSYWFLIFIAGLSLELIALYFQYQLGYGPCVLCIEIRAVIFIIMAIALVAMLLCRIRLFANIMNIALSAAGALFYIKSDLLLRIERNQVESTCGFKAEFPQWLPLDVWLPAVFEPWEACGYTPMLWLDITMAEALVYCSYAVIALGVLMLIINLLFGKKKQNPALFS